MNYFRCTVGGGKGNTVTVTCAEEFAGLTITLAKTGKTYTKTCPSTAPYVVTFYGVENGTYTVSCIVDGQTYSETVIVQDISCVLNYGFSWKIWVDTASQLDSSDYDSLDEVLADEKALRELFLEHACVDYMASVAVSNEALETVINDDYCAKWINLSDYALDFLGANTVIKALMDEADKYGYGEWIITDSTTTPPTWGPKGNVPVMTANNAPYGEASASSTGSSTAPWYAFDRNTNTQWGANSTSFPQWVSYRFVNPVCVKKVEVNTSRVGTYKIQASNDNSTWTDLTDTISSTDGVTIATNIENSNYYLYHRVYCISGNSGGHGAYINEIQFYGRELKVSVPKMTSNTAPFGTVSASSTYSNSFPAWKGYNSSEQYGWAASSSGLTNAWCRYDFVSPMVIKAFNAIMKNNAHLSNMKVQGLINNEWVDLLTFSVGTSAKKCFEIENEDNIECSSFRVYGTTNTDGDGYLFNFYGLDYSEKEFEVGTTKKWLYDHGVELETLSDRYNGVSAPIHGANCIDLAATGSGQYCQVYINMDLSDYDLVRAKSYRYATSNAKIAVQNNDYSSTLASAEVSVNGPYNSNLDISSINQTANLMATNNSGASSIWELAELWLE